jgi:mannose-6-phosphate isomerase-like protein (cupin superfamily)
MSVCRRLPDAYDVLAPDGSEVRLLVTSERGSMAHFTLPPGQVSLAVVHHSVEEVWYILSGSGRMWQKSATREEVIELSTGLSLQITAGTHFQFRNDGDTPLTAVAVTMPPWPGMDEAYSVQGKW